MRRIYWIIFKNKLKYSLEDWRNVAVFSIIFLIVFLYGLTIPKIARCIIPTCPQSEWINLPWRYCPICSLTLSDYLSGLIYHAILPISLIDYFVKTPDLVLLALMLVLQVLYWYMLSCIIVWIYDRFSQKFKRKVSKL